MNFFFLFLLIFRFSLHVLVLGDAVALLLLYDVTNKNSFDNIRAWLSEIREYAQENVVIMLLGTYRGLFQFIFSFMTREREGERE